MGRMQKYVDDNAKRMAKYWREKGMSEKEIVFEYPQYFTSEYLNNFKKKIQFKKELNGVK